MKISKYRVRVTYKLGLGLLLIGVGVTYKLGVRVTYKLGLG